MGELNESFPFEIRDVDPEQINQLKKYFNDTLYKVEVSRFGPKRYTLPQDYNAIGRQIYNMEIKPTDTFVVTYPRSGTTWTQEMVWLIANDFNYEEAQATQLTARFAFIESSMIVKPAAWSAISEGEKEIIEKNMPSFEKIINQPSPRFLKSHLPISLLPPKLLATCKVVYVARDPRDVAVSLYHHNELMNMLKKESDFKTYWNFFINDLLYWSPFFEHVKEAWHTRHHQNILFLFYEELSEDLPGCARRVAKFLNKEITDEQIQKLCEYLKIDNFKKNKSVNLEDMKQMGIINETGSFIRKGKVGGWRDYFDEEMKQQAEQWMKKNLSDTDLRFPQ